MARSIRLADAALWAAWAQYIQTWCLELHGRQPKLHETGKRHGFTNLRDWFKALYEVLFGQEQGPRMASFIVLYGVCETAALARKALAEGWSRRLK